MESPQRSKSPQRQIEPSAVGKEPSAGKRLQRQVHRLARTHLIGVLRNRRSRIEPVTVTVTTAGGGDGAYCRARVNNWPTEKGLLNRPVNRLITCSLPAKLRDALIAKAGTWANARGRHALMARKTSSPFMPGILMSKRNRSGTPSNSDKAFSNASPSAKPMDGRAIPGQQIFNNDAVCFHIVDHNHLHSCKHMINVLSGRHGNLSRR